MSSYQQAVSSFIQGYREGLDEGSKSKPEASADGDAASSDAAEGSGAFSAAIGKSGAFSYTVPSQSAGEEVSASSGVAHHGAFGSSASATAAEDGGGAGAQGGKAAAAGGLEQGNAAEQSRGQHEGIGREGLQGGSEAHIDESQESAMGRTKQTRE